MNPLIALAGLGILGFAVMGFTKKNKTYPTWQSPEEDDLLPMDPTLPPNWSGPDTSPPTWEGPPEDADPFLRVKRIPGRIA
tara:strand:+ start:1568 stop:1810 length:243 start_codon:yes stop_codon:yes gene_type:complete